MFNPSLDPAYLDPAYVVIGNFRTIDYGLYQVHHESIRFSLDIFNHAVEKGYAPTRTRHLHLLITIGRDCFNILLATIKAVTLNLISLIITPWTVENKKWGVRFVVIRGLLLRPYCYWLFP